MKILCIVDNTLQEVLIRGLEGYYFSFSDSWDKARRALLNESFDFVIAEGHYLEDPSDELTFWGAASQLRYFDVQSIFIDISFKATNVIVRHYPQIKQLSYRGQSSELFLQLQTSLPELFSRVPKHQKRVNSASANAMRYAVQQSSSLGVVGSSFGESASRRRHHSSFEGLQKVSENKQAGSFNAISNLPLGMRSSTPKSVPVSAQGLRFDKPVASEDSSLSSDFSFILSDLPSSSGLTPISGISDIDRVLFASSEDTKAIAAKTDERHDKKNRSTVSAVSSFADTCSPPNFVDNDDKVYTIRRSSKDILLGSLEFATLTRVLHSIMQLKLTGILNIQSDVRTIRIEFKDGAAFSNASRQLIISAMSWTLGDYSFNPGAMLSMHTEPVALKELITAAFKSHLPLNALLRALGYELQRYIILTDRFDETSHETVSFPWWRSCDGRTKLTEIMLSGNTAMDELARDIYLSWVRDEIVFTDTPFTGKVKIIYEKVRARPSTLDRNNNSSLGIEDDARSSHIFAVKSELRRIITSFKSNDGYTILGLKQGCGIKALSDSYYAWINRYHTDRFIRFKDEELIQLANELLVKMNSLYSKLSKVERLNTSTLRPLNSSSRNPRFNELSESPQRIGGTRARVSTLPPNEDLRSGHKLSHISRNLKALQNDAHQQPHIPKRQSGAQRPQIRPPSAASRQSIRAVAAPHDSQTSEKAQKMSDILAERQRSSQELSALKFSSNSSSHSAIERKETITPEQYFQTGKKKLLLGLNEDALSAFEKAIEGDANNKDYISHHAYTQFLIDPQSKDEALDILKAHIDKTKGELKVFDSETTLARLFTLLYFAGKIALAIEDYEAAQDYLKQASKLQPADIDTQRSLRFAAMQLEKAKQKSSNRNFFAKLKDRFKDN